MIPPNTESKNSVSELSSSALWLRREAVTDSPRPSHPKRGRGQGETKGYSLAPTGGDGAQRAGEGVRRTRLNSTVPSRRLALLSTSTAFYLLILALPVFGQYGASQGGVPQTNLPKPLV